MGAERIGVKALSSRFNMSIPEADSLVRMAESGNSRAQRQLNLLSGFFGGEGAAKATSNNVPYMITDRGMPSNTGMGVKSILGLAAIGAGAGGLSAYSSGGNVAPGALWGGLIGGALGAFTPRSIVQDISRKAAGIPFAGAHMTEGNLRRGATVGAGFGVGVAFSGNRGDDKRRGFNAKRGNKISSSRY